MNDKSHKEREHFFAAAKVLAAMTMLSRICGLIRDVAIVSLGATRAMDTFWTAFSVPNLFRRLFGEGAFSAALRDAIAESYLLAERMGMWYVYVPVPEKGRSP